MGRSSGAAVFEEASPSPTDTIQFIKPGGRQALGNPWFIRPVGVGATPGSGSPLPSVGPQVVDLRPAGSSAAVSRIGRLVFAAAGAIILAVGLVLFPGLRLASIGAVRDPITEASSLIALGAGLLAIAAIGALMNEPTELRLDDQGLTVESRRGGPTQFSWSDPNLRGSMSHAVYTSPQRAADPPKGWVITIHTQRGKVSTAIPFEAGNAIEERIRRLGIPSAEATLPWVGRGREASVLEIFEFAANGSLGTTKIPLSKRTTFPREKGRPPVP